MHLSSYTESQLFDLVDRDRKGWISLSDLDYFMTYRFSGSTYARVERAFRRMDEDSDGRILFEEFLRAVRPVYLYPSYADYYNVRRNTSPLRYKGSFNNRSALNTTKLVSKDVYRTPSRNSIRESVRRSRQLRNSYLSPARRSLSRRSLADDIREEVLAKS